MAQKFERGTGPRSFRPAFNRGGRPGGRPGGFSAKGGPASGWGGRSDGPKTMHQATCSTCNKDCQVPFRPTGDKPVYCRDCFNKQGGDRAVREERGDRRDERPDARRDFAPAPMRISPSVPVANGENNNTELKKQLENVNVKLERLISAVQALTPMLAALKPVTAEKLPAKKATKKISTKK
ncbi:MAG TPA: CxxC-x17-CxxC domain-containing protein [Candidatus Paceibacterota bacterium]